MPSLPGAAAVTPARAETALDALAFHLNYLDAKLTAIREEFAEDMSTEHAHDLDSASDELRQACGALEQLRARPDADPHAARSGTVDFEEFTARWDQANEPINALLSDQPVFAVAQWAAARARYELAFVEAVRPVEPGPDQRIEHLTEAGTELDRACRALEEHRSSIPPRRVARRRR